MKGNIILQLNNDGPYTLDNVLQKLNIGGIPDLLRYSNATVGDLLLEDIHQGVVLWDASISRYEKGSNDIIDILLESIGFQLVKIVDNDGKEIIDLKNK